MAIDIQQREVGSVTILDLAGKLSGASGDSVFRSIDDLSGAARRLMILNLARVTFIDSASLGGLVSKRSEVLADGGDLKLLNATTRISDLLVTTKLEMVFDTFTSEQEAVRSLTCRES